MNNLLDILNTPQGQSLISGASQQLGLDSNQTQNVLSMALPVLVSGLNNNTNQPGGAESLLSALSQHDGSVLDNISGFLKGGDFSDGTKILGHIFGGSQNKVAETIGKSTGISSSQIGQLLIMAAPILMGFLGKTTQQQGLNSSGLSDMLSSAISDGKTNNAQGMSVVERMLDQNNDGSIIDDVAGIGMKLFGGFMKK